MHGLDTDWIMFRELSSVKKLEPNNGTEEDMVVKEQLKNRVDLPHYQ